MARGGIATTGESRSSHPDCCIMARSSASRLDMPLAYPTLLPWATMATPHESRTSAEASGRFAGCAAMYARCSAYADGSGESGLRGPTSMARAALVATAPAAALAAPSTMVALVFVVGSSRLRARAFLCRRRRRRCFSAKNLSSRSILQVGPGHCCRARAWRASRTGSTATCGGGAGDAVRENKSPAAIAPRAKHSNVLLAEDIQPDPRPHTRARFAATHTRPPHSVSRYGSSTHASIEYEFAVKVLRSVFRADLFEKAVGVRVSVCRFN